LTTDDEIKGTAGAGDAFCAGMLFGLHEDLSLSTSLRLANASARFNLTSPTCTDGAVSLIQLNQFIESSPARTPIPEGLG
jgi:sugar/nucleoside kinase (ribokinase family)